MAELGFGVSGSRHGLDHKRPLQSHHWLTWPARDQAETGFGQRKRAVSPAPSPAPHFLPLPWPPRPSPRYLVSVSPSPLSPSPLPLPPPIREPEATPLGVLLRWEPPLPVPSLGSRPHLSYVGASGWLSSRDNRGSWLAGGLSPPMTTPIPSFLLFWGCHQHQSVARPGPSLSRSPPLFSSPPELVGGGPSAHLQLRNLSLGKGRAGSRRESRTSRVRLPRVRPQAAGRLRLAWSFTFELLPYALPVRSPQDTHQWTNGRSCFGSKC